MINERLDCNKKCWFEIRKKFFDLFKLSFKHFTGISTVKNRSSFHLFENANNTEINQITTF